MDLTLEAGKVSNLKQQNVIMSPGGLGTKNAPSGEDQQQL
jgi:hypothetical protein